MLITFNLPIQCQTSNIPFLAMITGKQGSGCWEALANDIKPLNAAAALAISTLWVLRKVK